MRIVLKRVDLIDSEAPQRAITVPFSAELSAPRSPGARQAPRRRARTLRRRPAVSAPAARCVPGQVLTARCTHSLKLNLEGAKGMEGVTAAKTKPWWKSSPESANPGRRGSPPGRATVHHRSRPSRRSRVLWQGQPVAIVLARTRAIAEDAVERIEAEWEPLDAVADPEAALAPRRAAGASGLRQQPRLRARHRGRRGAAGRPRGAARTRGSRAIPAYRSSRARSSPTSTPACGSLRCTSRRRCRTRCARCTPSASASPSRTCG